MYSTRDFLCDLIANRRPTRKVTTPAGIVKISKKAAAPPPVVSSLTNRIGQNVTHAEITEIVTMLRTILGRSTVLRTRAGEYALSRIMFPRDYDIVHSSSSLAKGFFPEAHIQMRNKIRIDQGIAIATIWPKYSSEMK